jgi:hypothetical protein
MMNQFTSPRNSIAGEAIGESSRIKMSRLWRDWNEERESKSWKKVDQRERQDNDHRPEDGGVQSGVRREEEEANADETLENTDDRSIDHVSNWTRRGVSSERTGLFRIGQKPYAQLKRRTKKPSRRTLCLMNGTDRKPVTGKLPLSIQFVFIRSPVACIVQRPSFDEYTLSSWLIWEP